MSPADWLAGIQNIPDKNDILDMFMHVRRSGPNRTDSLWMFGALSLDNTTGNRYFDFEMYQTDIYYDRASGKWFGYGPDAGHTSWQFDAAGNIVKPGDIIFSAEYQSSTLSNVEARIWVNKTALSLTPSAFDWSGQFDGASSGAQYGYASILPKTAGAFYTGLGSGNKTWAGPFQLVLQNNNVVTEYTRDQFMEFAVNLTKLGLDPVTTFGTDICGTPFNRMVVKTRSSASFTSELKDFVAPTDLFLSPRVNALTDVPLYCGVVGVSNLMVQNPSPSSVYTWSTTDGHIVGPTSGTETTVDSPGTYIVMQQLAEGCNPYAYDTVAIVYDASCGALANQITGFRGSIKNTTAYLNWSTTANKETAYFEVQRSANGKDFKTIGKIEAVPFAAEQAYSFHDNIAGWNTTAALYRLRVKMNSGMVLYSTVVKLELSATHKQVMVFPNPANDVLQLSVPSEKNQEATVSVFDLSGSVIKTTKAGLKQGGTVLQLDVATLPAGTYLVHIETANRNEWKKFVVNRLLYNK